MRDRTAEQPLFARDGRVPVHAELRDAAWRTELADLLAHDRRTELLDLSVDVHEGVAHVGGKVASEEERTLVRRLARRPAGLYAVWDLLELRDQELVVVDVGCGDQKQVEGAIGVDRVPQPEVDVVADLEDGLPLEGDSVDHVFAVHVLEHVRDLVAAMAELHRVLRPTGVLHVLAPDWRHVNAVADPTHVRLLDRQTFKWFCTDEREPRWRPLIASTDESTVYADLQPLAGGERADRAAVARWFR